MNDRTDTPGTARSITEHTPVKLTLSRAIVIAAAIVGISVTVNSFLSKTGSRIDAVESRIKGHAEDKTAHLPENYYQAHGAPAGSIDLQLVVIRLDTLQRSVERVQEIIQEKKR